VTGTTAWLPLEMLGTAVRVASAASGREHFAVRAIQFNELRLRARALLPEVRKELAEADPPVSGVGDLKTRIEMWGGHFLLAARVVMLQLIVDGTLDQAAFSTAEDAAVQLWSLPGMMRVSLGGDRSISRLGGGVETPLELIARFRTRSPVGVALTWSPAPGFRGAISGDSTFDPTGRAQARVHNLQPTGDEFGYVQAAIDVDRVLGRRTGIELQPWLWTIILPARTNSELMLELTESINRDAEVEPMLVPEMRTWCRSRNMTLRSPAAGFSDAPYRLTLRGSLDVRSWMEADVPIAHATGRIELVDASTGQVLFRFFPGVKKGGRRGNTEAAMILAARQDAIADIVSEIGARMLALVPAQGDEFGRGG
jgi:hypothetical protein